MNHQAGKVSRNEIDNGKLGESGKSDKVENIRDLGISL